MFTRNSYTQNSITLCVCVCVCMCVCISHSVMSDSLWPGGLFPTRLLCLWDSPGKNTGVRFQFLLQGIFLTQGSNPGLPHRRQILYHLSHQGSPCNNLSLPHLNNQALIHSLLSSYLFFVYLFAWLILLSQLKTQWLSLYPHLWTQVPVSFKNRLPEMEFIQ